MNSPAKDICTILEQTRWALSLVFGTNLFVDILPENPDLAVSVFNLGGRPPLSLETVHEYPSIQIMVRGGRGGQVAAYDLSHNIKIALHKLTDEIISSVRYLEIVAQGDILTIGSDSRQRPLYSINFNLYRTY